ncbi:MAG: hypothetical protein AB1489_28740 [Acidobacteriota bacterium]
MTERFEIEWMPFARSERKWWVYAYACAEDGTRMKGLGTPTTRLVGQYESMEAAINAHPDAIISEKTQRAIQEDRHKS